MFSFFGKKNHDSFANRQKQQQVWRAIRRIVDSHSMSNITDEDNRRVQNRYRRCLPVAFFPAHQDEVEATHCYYGITKDFSDNGLSLIVKTNFSSEFGVCGFWLDQPVIFEAIARRVVPFGGDMVEIGVELTELIESRQLHVLLHDALLRLDPRHAASQATDRQPVSVR